jgi:hypothetical protein
VEMLAHANQFLGQGRALKEAECGTGVKFDVQVQFSVLSSYVLGKISGRRISPRTENRELRTCFSVIRSFQKPRAAKHVMH